MSVLSYKYRIEPNKAQSAALADIADFCRLYNACLVQRRDAWRRQISVGYTMQAAELKAVRCAIPELTRWSFSAEQQVLRRLDKTFKAFFARGRGFPRFRATARYHAADASWAQLTAMLDDEAARAGVEIVRVDPRGNSQTCPACGSEARKRRSDRVHRCGCGCTLDRDVAAAKVVPVRALGFMPGTGSGALSERVAA
jgi:transposase